MRRRDPRARWQGGDRERRWRGRDPRARVRNLPDGGELGPAEFLPDGGGELYS